MQKQHSKNSKKNKANAEMIKQMQKLWNYIQTIFYLDDMPDVMKAKEILIDIGKYGRGRYKRATEPFVQGFKQNNTQYGVCFWEQV